MVVKAKKLRPTREFWGEWQDKSHLLIHHPMHRNGAKIFTAAYGNSVLAVQVSHEATAWGPVIHLWVCRRDQQPLTWREMQRVKDELVGPERVGVEVYPAVSKLVDVANMYHLWVLPEGFELPFWLDKQEESAP